MKLQEPFLVSGGGIGWARPGRRRHAPSARPELKPESRDALLTAIAKPTAHCFEFLRWAVKVHRPYWLTTRDAHGQHAGILRAFRHAIGSPELPSEIDALLTAIRPTEWSGT